MTGGPPTPRPSPDWTNGPAKWAAVVVLSATGVAGLAYSIIKEVPPRRPERVVSVPIKAANEPADQADISAGAAVTGSEAERETTPPEAPASPFAQTVDVNTATAAELDLLPGIGPARAAAIIESRETKGPFRSVDDLQRVSGIGPKTAEKLSPYVRFE
ncbi:MAG: ComEA family DNA-binding protein [Planctomycetota bacterium]